MLPVLLQVEFLCITVFGFPSEFAIESIFIDKFVSVAVHCCIIVNSFVNFEKYLIEKLKWAIPYINDKLSYWVNEDNSIVIVLSSKVVRCNRHSQHIALYSSRYTKYTAYRVIICSIIKSHFPRVVWWIELYRHSSGPSPVHKSFKFVVLCWRCTFCCVTSHIEPCCYFLKVMRSLVSKVGQQVHKKYECLFVVSIYHIVWNDHV